MWLARDHPFLCILSGLCQSMKMRRRSWILLRGFHSLSTQIFRSIYFIYFPCWEFKNSGTSKLPKKGNSDFFSRPYLSFPFHPRFRYRSNRTSWVWITQKITKSPIHVTRWIHNSVSQIWYKRNIGFKWSLKIDWFEPMQISAEVINTITIFTMFWGRHW